jgi:hypothetical protein
MNSELKVDWCSHEAAKYACQHWHYSKTISVGKAVKLGVWENGEYKGVVVFAMGAAPHIGDPYQLAQDQVCELTRIALADHSFTVSQVLSIAIKKLKGLCPGLRLIVSYADKDQDHAGIIYQATNWIYTGITASGRGISYIIDGRKVHNRTLHGEFGSTLNLNTIRSRYPHAEDFISLGKHKYLMPLDKKMRKQILPLSKPYPKSEKEVADAQN